MRLAQAAAAAAVPGVSFVTAMDLGSLHSQAGSCHSAQKPELGQRLARALKAAIYDSTTVWESPTVQRVVRAGDSIVLDFDAPGGKGLVLDTSASCPAAIHPAFCRPGVGFEVCSVSKCALAESAALRNGSRVVLNVGHGMAGTITSVRYAYADWPVVMLRDAVTDLPALPFAVNTSTGSSVALQAAAKSDDAPRMPPLQIIPSASGDRFTISTRDGTDWLGSAGPQFGGVALPREPAGSAPRRSAGKDVLGNFEATAVDYKLPNGGKLTATTRVYSSAASPGNMVAVFEQHYIGEASGLALGAAGTAHAAAQREVSVAFPTFTPPKSASPLPTPPPSPPANCSFLSATDFNGGDFQRLTSVSSPEACCALCAKNEQCKVFTWYTAARSGTTGSGTVSHCNLKHSIVKKLTNATNHTAGICQAHKPAPARGPPLNAWTLWGPSGMFNELTRLWSPGALINDAPCGSAGNDKGCDAMGPLVMYNRNLTTLVIAPLDNFMVHNTAADAETIRCGLRGTVKQAPDGFKLSTIVVGGAGVTATVREWGRLSLQQYGKPPAERVLQAAYASDPSLRYLSYWTDAGAAYYYETEHGSANTSMEQTMIDTKAWMRTNRVPTVSYQFDSWWYPQDSARPGGPVITWEPLRGVSPGMPSFHAVDSLPSAHASMITPIVVFVFASFQTGG
jgi:hypothetical protein